MVTGNIEDQSSQELTFRLEDSCAHCSKPITVEMHDGEFTTLDPDTVYVQQGGG